jgi:hypothetical protein
MMRRLNFVRSTDGFARNGKAYVSLQCVARSLTEANVLSHLVKHTKAWPVPYYREQTGTPIYFEARVAEAFLKADDNVVARGIKRRPMNPQRGGCSSEYAEALRRELIAMNLWTPEQRAVRGKQTHIGARHLIYNPPLPWLEEPSLFDSAPLEPDEVHLRVQSMLAGLREGARIYRKTVIELLNAVDGKLKMLLA